MHEPSDINLIIVGATARAAAGSAIRAGYRPWCADMFADIDLSAIAPAVAFEQGQYPRALASMIDRAKLPAGIPILLTGAMENHLDAIRDVLSRHPILGPDANAIAHYRNVTRSRSLQPAIPGIAWCETLPVTGWRNAMRWRLRAISHREKWIAKPSRSGGGVGVRIAKPWSRVHADDQLQQYIEGQCLGVLWRGGKGGCELLGVTRQIVGDANLGATRPFQYTGSIGPAALPETARIAVEQLGQMLWQHHPFQGLMGSDVILDDEGICWPVEFNPRYTASAEVLERACDFAAFDSASRPASASTGNVAGKVYVYSPCDGVLPDLTTLYAPDEVADISAPGSPVFARQPVCSLFAQADDPQACLDKLHVMAQRLYTRLRESERD